jgi:hypothetical protein
MPIVLDGSTGITTPGLVNTNPVTTLNGVVYTWPATSGSASQFLQSNGAGTLSWASVAQPQGIPTLSVVTGTTQAATSGFHYVLTNVAATTVTLPASPTAGDMIYVTVGNSLTTNVVSRNGNNIMGLAQDMTLDAQYAAAQLRYINSTLGWVMI